MPDSHLEMLRVDGGRDFGHCMKSFPQSEHALSLEDYPCRKMS